MLDSLLVMFEITASVSVFVLRNVYLVNERGVEGYEVIQERLLVLIKDNEAHINGIIAPSLNFSTHELLLFREDYLNLLFVLPLTLDIAE